MRVLSVGTFITIKTDSVFPIPSAGQAMLNFGLPSRVTHRVRRGSRDAPKAWKQ